MRKKKKWILVVGSIFLLMVIIISAFIGYRQYEKHQFTSEKWNAVGGVWKRKYMVKDLEEKYQIIGMSRDEIIELLGQPEYDEKDCIIYELGTTEPEIEKYMPMRDPYPNIRYWIYFDKNNIAIKIKIDQESSHAL